MSRQPNPATQVPNRRRWVGVGVLVVQGLVAACGSSGGDVSEDAATPWPVTAFPELPAAVRDAPDERVELGRLLFYDPVLSIDDQTACATCHSEKWGMGDGIPRAIGHGAGLGAGPRRDGPNELRRNSPALYNLAFRPSLLWDGRAETLEEQVPIAITSGDELGLDEAAVVQKLSAIPEYVERFTKAFPDDPNVTLENLSGALATFERTLLSNRATYDAYASGRYELMDEEEIAGMFRFGELGCAECHVPPLFESETFADRRVPEVEGIVDRGLEERTGLEEDRNKFRTPTLRNLEATEPYFHNGSVTEISSVIRHEIELSGLPFTDEDVRLVRLFIHNTLRDESHNPIRPISVPSGLPMPIDPAGPGAEAGVFDPRQ